MLHLLDSATPIKPTAQQLDAIIHDKMDTWPSNYTRLMTYTWVMEFYDRDKIQKLMFEIRDLFAANGGDEYYYNELIYEKGSRAVAFRSFISRILSHSDSLDKYELRMQKVWNLAGIKIKEYIKPEEPSVNNIISTIIHRALLEYCKDTAVYFKPPYHIKAELQSGAYNVVQNCLHPVETMTSFFQTFGITGTFQQQELARENTDQIFIDHPMRSTVQVVGTAALIAKGVPLAWEYAKQIDKETANKLAVGGMALMVGTSIYNSVRRSPIRS